MCVANKNKWKVFFYPDAVNDMSDNKKNILNHRNKSNWNSSQD